MRRIHRFHFLCPHCGHDFWRKCKLERSTPCPECKTAFTKREHLAPDHRATADRFQSAAARDAQIRIEFGKASGSGIRNAQVPTSLAEARFKRMARDAGLITHRPSWPDYLLEDREGCFAVEVKAAGDAVSPSQRASFDLLERLGVRVYVCWDPSGPVLLLRRWRERSADLTWFLNDRLRDASASCPPQLLMQGEPTVRGE